MTIPRTKRPYRVSIWGGRPFLTYGPPKSISRFSETRESPSCFRLMFAQKFRVDLQKCQSECQQAIRLLFRAPVCCLFIQARLGMFEEETRTSAWYDECLSVYGRG